MEEFVVALLDGVKEMFDVAFDAADPKGIAAFF